MKTNFLTFFKTSWQKHWTAKVAAQHFANVNYGSVLKVVKKPIEQASPQSVYLNLYRLIALRETGREQWAEELAMLNRADWLGHLGQDEKNYILVYLLDKLFGEIDIHPFIALKNVPETTRQTLPIDIQDPKFLKFFRRSTLPNRPSQPVTLHGFHAHSISVPTVIRFSNNYQNHKLFCLGKGSSFFS